MKFPKKDYKIRKSVVLDSGTRETYSYVLLKYLKSVTPIKLKIGCNLINQVKNIKIGCILYIIAIKLKILK